MPSPPPQAYIDACRERYGISGKRNGRRSNRNRAAGNRSFPTGYPIFNGSAADPAFDAHVAATLDALLPKNTQKTRVRMAVRADRRVFVGPSDEDIAALPWIDDAWVCAEGQCDQIGLRSRTGVNANLRYGLVLDFMTRRIACDIATAKDGLASDDADQRYGLDVTRICVEHNAPPEDLFEYGRQLLG